MKKHNNRILFVSYHFPPSAAVGGQRIANFSTCLASLGWETHVLTIEDRNVERMDPDRLRGVAGVIIHKVGVLPIAASLYRALVARCRALLGQRAFFSGHAGAPNPGPSGRALNHESPLRRLQRYILSFLGLPDFERGWILPAVVKAVRTIRQHRVDWFLTSCPPYSVHLIGLFVKILTGSRWIVDFRDPWMTTGSKRQYSTSALSIRIESWLERKVIEKSDLVVFNVERLRNAYRDRYAHVPAEKFVFLPNGIAPQQASDRQPVAKYTPFTLSYTGALYVGRSPEPIFQAVSNLIGSGTVAPEGIRVKLVGHCRTIEGVPTASVIRKYGLDSVVEVHDSVSHREALDIIRRSQLALLFAPNLPYQIPAKIYDYLGTGTRILAIAEEGGTADLIKETHAGLAFSPEDIDGIRDFIRQEMTSGLPMNGPHTAALARFDVRAITEQLVGHLGRIEAMESRP